MEDAVLRTTNMLHDARLLRVAFDVDARVVTLGFKGGRFDGDVTPFDLHFTEVEELTVFELGQVDYVADALVRQEAEAADAGGLDGTPLLPDAPVVDALITLVPASWIALRSSGGYVRVEPSRPRELERPRGVHHESGTAWSEGQLRTIVLEITKAEIVVEVTGAFVSDARGLPTPECVQVTLRSGGLRSVTAFHLAPPCSLAHHRGVRSRPSAGSQQEGQPKLCDHEVLLREGLVRWTARSLEARLEPAPATATTSR